MYDKESIYDEKIFSLMSEIIKICRENSIQVLASFALKESDENGNDLACTTYIPSDEYKSDRIEDAMKVIRNGYIVQKPFFAAITITSK